ncbi:MAG: gliding motility-associated C-terminal domain-containing protein [Bacteroidetes bacterium]|nr:gliding motility-associated C-terminal domain-containing protein [Bacteroidota bacterium]
MRIGGVCTRQQSIDVIRLAPPLDLGVDKYICASGGKAMFQANSDFENYLWNSGERTKSISTSAVGKHKLTAIASNGCVVSDSVNLLLYPMSVVDLGPDKSICAGVDNTLDAGAGFSYLWNNNLSTQTISVSESGIYSVVVTDKNGCKATDSVTIQWSSEVLPIVDLQSEFFVCAGEETVISVQTNGSSILWSTGDTTASVKINRAGNYSVKVSNGLSCAISKSTKVISERYTDKLKSTKIQHCFRDEEILQISAETNANAYRWWNGATSSSTYISEKGLYPVQLISVHGCSTFDTISVVEFCSPMLYVPNAFTPNGDETNATFYALSSEPLEEFNLQIYNRWGELLFETNDISHGWSGVYKGEVVQMDVYVWKIKYKYRTFFGLTTENKIGSVTLIK